MPIVSFDDVLGCLAVTATGENRFRAPNISMPYSRIFGGQLLAQCIAISAATAEGKTVKSLHATFPREGDLAESVDYRVETVQDGRTFATRRISGEQNGKCVFSALVSLHAAENGLSHQLDAPAVAGPEDATPIDLSMVPWETRSVDGVDLGARDTGPARYALWMRAPALPDSAVVHQALLAHATDLTLIGTTLRPHPDLSEADSPARLRTAVTTHTLWFHRAFRLDDWLLLSQESPSAAGARGFGLGHVFTRAGILAASFAQESMIRLVD